MGEEKINESETLSCKQGQSLLLWSVYLALPLPCLFSSDFLLSLTCVCCCFCEIFLVTSFLGCTSCKFTVNKNTEGIRRKVFRHWMVLYHTLLRHCCDYCISTAVKPLNLASLDYVISRLQLLLHCTYEKHCYLETVTFAFIAHKFQLKKGQQAA